MLHEELKGQIRIPPLCYPKPSVPLESLNLQNYEVLPCEPMHDLSNHIDLIFKELPHHVSPDVADILNKSFNLVCGPGKDKKRACDMRAILIIAADKLHGKAPLKVQQLINTLVEMQHILYQPEYDRTPRNILRLHNKSFLHSILCFEVLGYQPKKITRRKLYGKYFHNLSTHAPMQLRIISGQSCNAEDEERTFNAITSITKSTSSNHPSHVIGNVLIRLQCEDAFKEMGNHARKHETDAYIHQLSLTLPNFPNTLFPSFVQHKYRNYWQAHLERISDFLLAGPNV